MDGTAKSSVSSLVRVGAGPEAPLDEARLGWSLTRGLDIVLSLLGLVFLAPLMLVICALIYVLGQGQPLFGHARVGFAGKTFTCWKFRSMVVGSEKVLAQLLRTDPRAAAEWAEFFKLKNDPRVTRLGRFLRAWSLDELPQLFNVLRGEMSLVGPRPIVLEEVARYGRHFRFYARSRPGLTGLWQVSGRSHLAYRRRVAIDVLFARRAGLGQYVKVLILTVPAVLTRSGAQ